MDQRERDTETETESDTEPEEEHEEESTEEEGPDEEDIELLETEPTLYTNQDPGYQAELKRTCPPHPLFVLKWNRQTRTPNNRYNRGGDHNSRYNHGQDQRHNQSRQPPQSSSSSPHSQRKW